MINQIKAEIHKMIANSIVQHLAGVWEMYEKDFPCSVILKNEAIDVLVAYLNSKKVFEKLPEETTEMNPIEEMPHAT